MKAICAFFCRKLSVSVLVTDSFMQWILFLWNRVKTVSIFHNLLQGSFNFLIFRGTPAFSFKCWLVRPNCVCQITTHTHHARYSLNTMFSCTMDITVINFFFLFIKLNFPFFIVIYEVPYLGKIIDLILSKCLFVCGQVPSMLMLHMKNSGVVNLEMGP